MTAVEHRARLSGSALAAALSRPQAYGDGSLPVEVRETHISWVFLVGDRAYKLKKPVRLPFVDYGTIKRRHDMCVEGGAVEPPARTPHLSRGQGSAIVVECRA